MGKRRSRQVTVAVTAGLSAALSIGLVSCADSLSGGGGFKDVEGVTPVDADSYRLINNVDGYPNIVIVCTSGVALVTTTRDGSQAALQHFPELDPTCPGYVQRTGE